MINKAHEGVNYKLYKAMNIGVCFLIFVCSFYLSYTLLSKIFIFNYGQYVIIKKSIIRNPAIEVTINKSKDLSVNQKGIELPSTINDNIINEQNIVDSEETKILNSDPKLDYFTMKYKNKEYLLSDSPKSYEYGFITKEMIDNVLYLYSHNSYKFTENSGYYLYNNLKSNDILVFNGNQKYKVVSISEVNFDQDTVKNIKLNKGADIVYFTCTPSGDNIRRVYQLVKL